MNRAILTASLLVIAAVCHATPVLPKTFLFPILKNGPNNQKRDLRSFLALAKELGCGIILTGVFKHHWDTSHKYNLNADVVQAGRGRCFTGNVTTGYMRIPELLDRSVLDAWVTTATVAELQAQGWSGALDAVLYPAGKSNAWEKSKRYIKRSVEAEPGVFLPHDAPHLIAVEKAFQCGVEGGMRGVAGLLGPFQGRVVGVMHVFTADNSGPDLKKEREAGLSTQGPCQQTVFEANRLLRAAPWIEQVALQYRQQHFSPNNTAYLAVHLRPYPDQCVDQWQPDRIGAAGDKISQCTRQHQQLHRRFGPCLKKRLKKYGLKQVYIMTHPSIWPTVSNLLEQAGITGVWRMDSERLSQLAGCEDHSASFLAMVEEEVAVQSSQFLGTYWSSITHSIVYNRLGMGKTANEYLEKSC